LAEVPRRHRYDNPRAHGNADRGARTHVA
jgi:hypothetical protein